MPNVRDWSDAACVSTWNDVRAYVREVSSSWIRARWRLSSLAQEQKRRKHLTAASDAAHHAANLSRQLYTTGLRDFRDMLHAQRSLLSLQDTLASSNATVSSELVRLYKTLGGSWSASTFLLEAISLAP